MARKYYTKEREQFFDYNFVACYRESREPGSAGSKRKKKKERKNKKRGGGGKKIKSILRGIRPSVYTYTGHAQA